MSSSRDFGFAVVVGSLLLPACMVGRLPRLSPATGAGLSSCQALATGFTFANTVITLAEAMAAGSRCGPRTWRACETNVCLWSTRSS
jgi:hypothetical protein